ncbi:MAG: GIY-YIG nuclease family protein, partial [Candidatus Omnitrophica bacterium]|nr:GIY-YIG nuclease family protein [Candidatus Omnitrophota bacterium]
MWFVYFLISQRHPKYIYVGLTSNIERRISQHN